MPDIYTAHFGNLPVRFVCQGGIVFVSRDDLLGVMADCFTPRLRKQAHRFLEGGLSILGNASDRRRAILGESEIGPIIHFHAVGALLHALSDLADVDGDELRESSYRINALLRWYRKTLPGVDRQFGIGFADMLGAVADRMNSISPPVVVSVTQGDGMYTAECDELHLVTEAETFEALRERVWELAPDMIEANALDLDIDQLRLSFQFAQSANDQARAG